MAKLIGLDNINMPAYKAALKKIEEVENNVKEIENRIGYLMIVDDITQLTQEEIKEIALGHVLFIFNTDEDKMFTLSYYYGYEDDTIVYENTAVNYKGAITKHIIFSIEYGVDNEWHYTTISAYDEIVVPNIITLNSTEIANNTLSEENLNILNRKGVTQISINYVNYTFVENTGNYRYGAFILDSNTGSYAYKNLIIDSTTGEFNIDDTSVYGKIGDYKFLTQYNGLEIDINNLLDTTVGGYPFSNGTGICYVSEFTKTGEDDPLIEEDLIKLGALPAYVNNNYVGLVRFVKINNTVRITFFSSNSSIYVADDPVVDSITSEYTTIYTVEVY